MFSVSPVPTLLRVLRGKPLIQRRSRRWASVALLASSLMIVGAAAVTSYWLVRQIILDGVKANALLTVEKAGDDIDQWLATRVAEVETLANQVAIRSMHLEAVIPFLSLEADRLPEYRFLMYAYPDGSHYRTDQGFVRDQKILHSPSFKTAIAGGISISGLVRTPENELNQISIAAPVWSVSPLRRSISPQRAEVRAENLYAFGLPDDPYEQPKPIGALVGVIPLKHIADVVSNIPKVPGSYAFVLDNQGLPIAQPDTDQLPQTDNLLRTADPVWQDVYQTMRHHQRGVRRIQVGNDWMYVAYMPLQRADWSLALVIPTNQVENQLDALNMLAIVVAGVLVIAGVIGLQQIRLLEESEDRSAELAATNTRLQEEIKERQRAEAALRESQIDLEDRVAARTAELATANQVLQTSEIQLKHQAHQLEQALQELQQTQAQLVQTEKMSSLGQLVAGIAHEINNPVNFIHANLPYAEQYMQDLIQLIQLYQEAYPNPVSEVQEKAEEIEVEFLTEDLAKLIHSMQIGTERIRQLVLSLRNFSRLDEAEMKQVDIHEGLDNTLMILQNRLKPKSGSGGIQVLKEYHNPYLVHCYAGQLNQVFMNILANAIDALESSWEPIAPTESAVRTLQPAIATVSAYAELEPSVQGHHAAQVTAEAMEFWQRPQFLSNQLLPTICIQTIAQEEGWVEIHIADNGPGMSETVCQKVFDPFFTTKPVGQGTGLGMSISYQIVVERHGGQLLCHSTPGSGTEFVIRIPVQQSATKAIAPDVVRS
ncbi:sensor histidine kinase [Pantanalinema sp. GBBB05]|uniref:sensor histidine kinase n=1 Tax=Pantanalinema sp. GBBB05 TaxID=2604139 RepID=UPI001D9290F4|nr:histidine kinase [Pantanalinema sp. GBBB05]